MSKIDKYSKYSYPSIAIALRELTKPYKIENPVAPLEIVYTTRAIEEAVAFLCMNNIQHTFIVHEAYMELSARVVMVIWETEDGEECLAWWEECNEQDNLYELWR